MKVSKILRAKLGDEVSSSKVFLDILRITKRANIHIIFLFSYS